MKFPELKGSSYGSTITKIGLTALRLSYEYRRKDGQTDRVISRTRHECEDASKLERRNLNVLCHSTITQKMLATQSCRFALTNTRT